MSPPVPLRPLEPGLRRTMLVVTTLFIAIMAALDLTIISVSLPYMSGNLGATPTEITWTMTMFTVAQAITIGITGHVSRVLGRKRLAIVAVTGFVISSALCGLAQDLVQIVVMRFIQGVFSAPLIPLSQSIIVDAYPAQERTKVMALWVMGVMGGPAAGPALGGYLAQNLDWRWNFWVNLPLGAIALLLILRYVRPVPAQKLRTDVVGLVLLAVSIVCLQIALDQGDILDWFGSKVIAVLLIVAISSFFAFVWRGWRLGEANIIDLSLFTDRNFAVCCLLLAVLAACFLGLVVMSPELFIDDFEWEIVTAGYVIGLYGVAGIFAATLSSRLGPVLGTRKMMCISLPLIAYGWYLYSRIGAGASPAQVTIPGMLIEGGVLLTFAPLAAQAFTHLSPHQRDEGAGLLNFCKTLGMSLGVAALGTLTYRGGQRNFEVVGAWLQPTRPGMDYYLQQGGLTPYSERSGAVLFGVLDNAVGILTITQAAQVMMVFTLCALPLVLLLEPHERPA